MSVTKIASMQEFDAAIAGSSVPVFVDFSAVWCGPCRMFGPVFELFSEEHAADAACLNVDVDQCPDIAMRYGINAVPTTLIFKNGQLAGSMLGASDKPTLDAHLAKLA